MTTHRPRPVIFDMDGVLVDSEPVYERAFRSFIDAIGRRGMEAWYPKTLGRRQADYVPELAAALGHGIDEVAAGLSASVAAHLDCAPPAMPGVPEAVYRIAHRRATGLASSSRRVFVDRVLAGLGLSEVFSAVATGDEVSRGKPHPDLYQLAARRLGIDPADAIAIEDTPAGIASAKAAGLTVIAIPNAHTRGLDLEAADVVVDSLEAAAAHIALR